MLGRLGAFREGLGFAELAIAFIVVMAFAIGGLIGGTSVTILGSCSGACPSDTWVALNPAAGLLAAATVVVALIAIDRFMRRRPG